MKKPPVIRKIRSIYRQNEIAPHAPAAPDMVDVSSTRRDMSSKSVHVARVLKKIRKKPESHAENCN